MSVAYSMKARLTAAVLAVLAGIGIKLTFNAPVFAALAAAAVFTSGFLRGDVRPDLRDDPLFRPKRPGFAPNLMKSSEG